MKYFLFVFFISVSIFAQYTGKDKELVKTTFERNFDSNIIENYLSSPNPEDVIAGLLSVSHSEDTSFIPLIIGLDFNQFGKYISFVLGQIGPSDLSRNFVMGKLSSKVGDKYSYDLFEAIGKIGNESDYHKIISMLKSNSISNRSGISIAIYNFFIRGIIEKNDEITNILLAELNNPDNNLERKFEAIFCLYRIGGSIEAENSLIKILDEPETADFAQIKNYALGCFRRLAYFPDNFELADKLLKAKDWSTRCEASRALVYYSFEYTNELNSYLSLLQDNNPNVARECAASLKNIKLSSELKSYLHKIADSLLSAGSHTKNTKGELFQSFCTLYQKKTYDFIENYKDKINTKYIYRVLNNYTQKPDKNLKLLKTPLKYADEKELIDLVPALFTLQKNYVNNKNYYDLLLNSLESEYPSTITLSAFSFDSASINNMKNELMTVILSQTNKYLNNPNYLESLQALESLAQKVDANFHDQILKIFYGSKVYSISKYAAEKLNRKIPSKESPELFNQIWEDAFKYRRAVVNTGKGRFTIQLYPEYSPVTVGNFCRLAEKKYFEGVSFHRVVPNFVIQTGDPNGTGWGGPGYEIVSEFSPLPFDVSYVGMASAGKDTEGSQWFVMQNNSPHLNGRYTNFGRVIYGMDIVNKTDQDDKIISIELQK